MRAPGVPPLAVPALAVPAGVPRFDKEGPDSPFAEPAGDDDARPPRERPALPAGLDAGALGEPIRQYAPSGQWWLILIGLGLLLVGIPLAGVVLTTGTIRLVAVAAIGALFVGGSFVYYGLIGLGRRVVVCEKGLADCWMLGARAHRWEDIRSVHQAVIRVFNGPTYSHTVHTFTVRTEGGRTLEYDDDFDGVALLGRGIQDGVASAKFPKAAADMDAGRWVEFDELRVGRAGIERGGEVLPWGGMEEIHAAKGELVVVLRGRKGGGEPIDVSRIPNLALLSRLIEHATGAGA